MIFCIENVISPLSFLMNYCFLKIFFPRLKLHFRLVEMTLKSITFVQNHKDIQHFYYNNVHLNDIFHFVSARNSSLHKQISCVKKKRRNNNPCEIQRCPKNKDFKVFQNITYPHIVWFKKLGYSRSNLKEVCYIEKLSMKFL